MNLIYIENKDLLSKFVTYLDYGNIPYTTDTKSNFDTLIVAQNNKKTISLMKRTKRVIYIAYLDELKIYNSFIKKGRKYTSYLHKMQNFLSSCNTVIVSIPYLKKIINTSKTIVIPMENLCLGLCKNKLFNLRRKKITIIDSDYKNLKTCFDLAYQFPNYKYEVIGYDALRSNSNKKLLSNLPRNLKLIKYCNNRLLYNYINNSLLVIFFDNILENADYLNICFNSKRNMLILKNELCKDYLIDNKNTYLFEVDDIFKKFNKIVNNRVCDLGVESYNLVKDNNFFNIADKFCKLFR